MIGNPLAEPEDRLAWEVRAVAERLRRLSPARLRMPLPPYPSREQAGRILAQQLADAAAGVVARDSDQPPRWHEVPEIEVFAVGEQVAVTGNDLVLELAGLSATGAAGAGEGVGRVPDGVTGAGDARGKGAGPLAADTVIWTRSGRRPLSAVIDELIATLRELRLGL
jgi:hypothetical protein